jgi:hypothetical protein
MLVIFVRSDDAADMAAAVCLQLSPARPETAGLEQDLGPGVEQKPFIPGRLPVLPDRVGDVRADVLLLLSAKDRNDLAIRTDDLLGRRLRAGIGRFPCVECPRQPIPAAFARAASRVWKRYINRARAASGQVRI